MYLMLRDSDCSLVCGANFNLVKDGFAAGLWRGRTKFREVFRPFTLMHCRETNNGCRLCVDVVNLEVCLAKFYKKSVFVYKVKNFSMWKEIQQEFDNCGEDAGKVAWIRTKLDPDSLRVVGDFLNWSMYEIVKEARRVFFYTKKKCYF